ncbi:MAG: hypothetical protein HS104_11490 [Polyangiaceae bacterium]|nr:hypothetical protein [Polyangiaceae bacterium]MCL4748599.1 hypothetical protein [Myxococcales bacterium]
MIAELLLGLIVTRAFEFRILDHQDHFSCRASNRYYSVALDVRSTFLSHASLPNRAEAHRNGDIFRATFRTRVWEGWVANPGRNMPFQRSSASLATLFMERRVMLANPVAGDDRFRFSFRTPVRDHQERSWNHRATRRSGDENFLLAFA